MDREFNRMELSPLRNVDCAAFSHSRFQRRIAVAPISKHLIATGSIAVLGCLLLAGPIAAQSAGEKIGVNSALGISPTTPDFVKEVAISDMFEIEASKAAQDKGNAPEKKFASQMVTDHTKTSADLKGLVSSGKVKAELPSALDSAHQGKLDKLKGESGKDFSSDFDSIQLSAHKDAVSLFERYAKGGDNADLKNWAGKTLPALKHHLEMAQSLSKSK
jgi:putative membrane protein